MKKRAKALPDISSNAGTVFAAIAAIMVMCLVLDQGGFKGLSTCMCGVVAAVALLAMAIMNRKFRAPAVQVTPLLFAVLALIYGVSTLINTPSLTSVSETGAWFAVAAFAFFVSYFDEPEKERAFTWLCWFGVITAVWGMLQCSGLLETPASVENGRLQITFEYANAAGIWFAVLAFISITSSFGPLRAAMPILLCAMLLTQSGGTLIVFAIGTIVLFVSLFRNGKVADLSFFLLSIVLAGIFMVLINITPAPYGAIWVVCIVILCAAYVYLQMESPAAITLEELLDRRAVLFILMGVLVVLAIVACFLFSSRLVEAIGTFVERGYQMADGLGFLTGDLLLGSGPDTWQYFFQYNQSYVYFASVMHNSFLQAALDAGVFAAIVLIAIACIGIISSFKAKQTGGAIALLVLTLHAVIDFDFAFGALAFMFVLLAVDGQGPAVPVKKFIFAIPVALVSLVVCIYGAVCDFNKMQITEASSLGEYETVITLTAQDPLALADTTARTECMTALYALQKYDEVEKFASDFGTASDKQALLLAAAQFENDKMQDASFTLLDALEQQPYNTSLYSAALALVNQYGIDADVAPVMKQMMLEAKDRGYFDE